MSTFKLGSFVFLAALAFSMSGCGNKNKNTGGDGNADPGVVSRNDDGTCAADFINQYNDILRSAQNVVDRAAFSKSNVSELKPIVQQFNEACDRFFRNHSSISCTAIQGGIRKTVNASDLQEVCQNGKSLMAEIKNPPSSPRIGEPAPAPAPVPSLKQVVNSDTPVWMIQANQVEISIKDLNAFKKIYDEKYFSKNGKTSNEDFKKLLEFGSTVCSIHGEADHPLSSSVFSSGQTFWMGNVEHGNTNDKKTGEFLGSWVGYFTTKTEFFVICYKISFSEITFKDMQDALSGILEFKVKQN